jgi:hypothetical protein
MGTTIYEKSNITIKRSYSGTNVGTCYIINAWCLPVILTKAECQELAKALMKEFEKETPK